MTSQPDPTPAPAQQHLSETEEANVRAGHQPMESDCTPGEIVCTGCEDEDGWPCTTQMLLNQIDAIREQHAHLLAARAGDREIIAGLKAERDEREERFRAANERQSATFKRLVAEKIEAREQLANERAANKRLRDQISTARAQLDAWQHNAPGATVQAAAATLAASPGPEAPEPEVGGWVSRAEAEAIVFSIMSPPDDPEPAAPEPLGHQSSCPIGKYAYSRCTCGVDPAPPEPVPCPQCHTTMRPPQVDLRGVCVVCWRQNGEPRLAPAALEPRRLGRVPVENGKVIYPADDDDGDVVRGSGVDPRLLDPPACVVVPEPAAPELREAGDA